MSRQRTVAAIASIIGSYRQGTVPPLDEEHIERWVSVFDEKVQLPILTELAHVLPRTFITREAFGAFFADAITNSELAGDDPCAFWSQADFFKQQIRGNSQSELLELFDAKLRERCGFGVDDCGSEDGPIIYVDDAAYTGIPRLIHAGVSLVL